MREKKPNKIEDLGYVDKEKLKGAKNPIVADVTKKCERGLQKIKRNPLAEYFINSVTPEAPSLNTIEKNLKNFQYHTIYHFGLDLRKLWNYFFSNYKNVPDVYQKTIKMSEFTEEVLKELETIPEEKSDIQELHKKVEKLSRDLKEYQGRATTPTQQVTTKKTDKSISILDKPMSMQEKNALGNNIRNLNAEQLKGIVTILSDSLMVDSKSRYFEFDIETLSTRKLRELERYVKSCLKSKSATATKTNDNKTKPQGSEGLSESDKIAQLKVIFIFYIFRMTWHIVVT